MTRSIFAIPLLATLVVAFAAPASSQDFRAENHMRVTATGAGSFTVSGMAELGARDYWCAAGDYATRRLGLRPTDRLFVTQPYAKSARSVGFSVEAGNLVPKGALVLGVTLNEPGSDMSVGQARGYCADRKLRRTS